MSNAERQRRFRARNPGYFNRYRFNVRHFRAQQEARAAAEAALRQHRRDFPETLFDLLPVTPTAAA